MSERDDFLNLLVYGPPKVGKTWLGGSAPKPILMLRSEAGGVRFLKQKYTITSEWNDPRNPPEEPEFDIYDLDIRNEAQVNEIRTMIRVGDHPFRSIIIDSITELQYRLETEMADPGQAMTFHHWRHILRILIDLISELIDNTEISPQIKCLAIIAGEREIVNERKSITGDVIKTVSRKPLISGQTGKRLEYKVDATGYLHVKTDESGDDRRLLQLVKADNIEAGNRLGGTVPDWVWDPDLTKMVEMISG